MFIILYLFLIVGPSAIIRFQTSISRGRRTTVSGQIPSIFPRLHRTGIEGDRSGAKKSDHFVAS